MCSPPPLADYPARSGAGHDELVDNRISSPGPEAAGGEEQGRTDLVEETRAGAGERDQSNLVEGGVAVRREVRGQQEEGDLEALDMVDNADSEVYSGGVGEERRNFVTDPKVGNNLERAELNTSVLKPIGNILKHFPV